MHLRYLTLFLFLLPGYLCAQQGDSTWVKTHYLKEERMIPVRDGIKLFTVIYRPNEVTSKHPVLFFRTAYSCAPYGQGNWMPLWRSYWLDYLKAGYILVLQDVRRRFKSEGNFVNIRPFIPVKKTKQDVDEASDAYDTIDWLLKNVPGNNGRVGVSGISYSGFYAAMAALCGHPALKAVSPQAPVTDWFRGDDLHHNGTFFLLDAFSFYVTGGFGAPRPKPTTLEAAGIPQPDTDSYRYYLHTGALTNFSHLAGDSIAFWKDLMRHPDYDRWWKARTDLQYVSRISPQTAILITGGLFDAEDSYGTWALYHAIAQHSRVRPELVIGPWYHGGWSGGKGDHLGQVSFGGNTGYWYVKHREEPFFAHYLLGKGKDTLPAVTVFFTGENRWHTFKHWPSAGKPVAVYLAQAHQLQFNRQNLQGSDHYTSDPSRPVPYTAAPHKARTKEYMDEDQRFASKRKDVLTYRGPVLHKELRLAGPLAADLWVSLSTTDADLVVKLIDEYPGSGYQQLVRGDIFRGRYRKSFSQPEPFMPGKVTEVRYTLPDIAHVFKKGHRLLVQVQSRWFPLADRNPQQFVNIYQARDRDFISSVVRVWHTKRYASRLLLPVL